MSESNGNGAAVAEPTLLELVERIKSDIKHHEEQAQQGRDQLKVLRDGLKGLGRGGARKPGVPRKSGGTRKAKSASAQAGE